MPETPEQSDRTSSRGFTIFGPEPVTCTFGAEVEVYESSAASGTRMWLSVVDFPQTGKPGETRDRAAAHLNVTQARKVRDRINAWLDRHDKDGESHDPFGGGVCPVCGEIIALGDMYVMDGDRKIHQECVR